MSFKHNFYQIRRLSLGILLIVASSAVAVAGKRISDEDLLQYRTDVSMFSQMTGLAPTRENLLKSLKYVEAREEYLNEMTFALNIILHDSEKFEHDKDSIIGCLQQNSAPILRLKCVQILIKIDAPVGLAYAKEFLNDKEFPLGLKLVLVNEAVERAEVFGYGVVQEAAAKTTDRTLVAMVNGILPKFMVHDGKTWNENGDVINARALAQQLGSQQKPR